MLAKCYLIVIRRSELASRASPESFVLLAHDELSEFTAFQSNELFERGFRSRYCIWKATFLDAPNNLVPQSRRLHRFDVTNPRNGDDVLRAREIGSHALNRSETVGDGSSHRDDSYKRSNTVFGTNINYNGLAKLRKKDSQYFGVRDELEHTVHTIAVSEIQRITSRCVGLYMKPYFPRVISSLPRKCENYALSSRTVARNDGSTFSQSPTMPNLASLKMFESASLFMATIALELEQPAICWLAPEIPTAM